MVKRQGLVVLIWAVLGLLLLDGTFAQKKTCEEKCERRTKCGRCLNFRFRKNDGCKCEWDGSTTDGSCRELSGSESEDLYKPASNVPRPRKENRKSCKEWKSSLDAAATPTPAPSVPKCTDRRECHNCLDNGCAWAFTGECLNSCSDIADVGCIALDDRDESGRKLLRFVDEASARCADYDLYKQNSKKCGDAIGCGHCSSIQLDVLPGSPPSGESCKWVPNAKGPSLSCIGFCYSECPWFLDCSEPVCEAWSPLDFKTDLCPDTSWECLEGQDVDVAKDALEDTYPELEIQQVPKGSPVTEDYVCTRVRLYYDEENRSVVGVPKIG